MAEVTSIDGPAAHVKFGSPGPAERCTWCRRGNPPQYGVLSRIMPTSQTSRTISFRIAEEKVAALDSIAKTMDRDRSYLLNEAVENYLAEQQQFAALVEEGREDMRHGRFLTQNEVERKVEQWETAGR